mmetsp:Transcript_45537/g.106510  ORF Transcript_45537/g.106510 Transcript_45537/m.106510 type:complete len:80 (-) Transcript_45537:1096-1335(-)
MPFASNDLQPPPGFQQMRPAARLRSCRRLSTAIHGLHGFQAALHALLAQLIWGYDSRHLSSFAASLSGMRKIQTTGPQL